MDSLPERIEAAEGPSRELDLHIMRWVENIGGDPENALHYTASIDATMTLVPDGWLEDFALERLDDGRQWLSRLGDGDEREVYSRAHTPALALCAAALKARAKEQPNEG